MTEREEKIIEAFSCIEENVNNHRNMISCGNCFYQFKSQQHCFLFWRHLEIGAKDLYRCKECQELFLD